METLTASSSTVLTGIALTVWPFGCSLRSVNQIECSRSPVQVRDVLVERALQREHADDDLVGDALGLLDRHGRVVRLRGRRGMRRYDGG